jgi:membrane protease YdiL (CAAX protease family)
MKKLKLFVQRYSLVVFFVLVYTIAWGLILLHSVSLIFPVLALFAPTTAALVVTGMTEGKKGVGTLLRRVLDWRVPARWYLVAIGLPLLLALAAIGLYTLFGGSYTFQEGNPLVVTLVLALLVIGEEIGWRGFALPRLQQRYNSLAASLILGGLWAAWHLANGLIPGLSHYWTAFPAFLLYVVGMTILFTWIANNTRGSVFMAWLFHAAINTFGAIFYIGLPVQQWRLSAAVYLVTALIVILLTGPNLRRQRAAVAAAPSI